MICPVFFADLPPFRAPEKLRLQTGAATAEQDVPIINESAA
jgi:hypothetical protein